MAQLKPTDQVKLMHAERYPDGCPLMCEECTTRIAARSDISDLDAIDVRAKSALAEPYYEDKECLGEVVLALTAEVRSLRLREKSLKASLRSWTDSRRRKSR